MCTPKPSTFHPHPPLAHSYHNFYAQIKGRKRFTVLSPTDSMLVRPYPFLHPCHAQCQTNLSDPAIGPIAASTVVLEPGDLLYLPPLYFHHVVSLESSVSVNAWTDTEQSQLAQTMLDTPLPPIPSISGHSPASISAWTALYIAMSVLAVCAHTRDDPVGFVASLVDQRYSTLLAEGRLPAPLWSQSDVCNSSLQAAGMAEFNPKEYAAAVCGAADQLPASTAALWLGNYIEGTVALALGGDPDHVGHILNLARSCSCGHGLPHCGS